MFIMFLISPVRVSDLMSKLNCIKIQRFHCIICWLVINIVNIMRNIVILIGPWILLIIFYLNCIKIYWFNSIISWLVMNVISVMRNIIIILGPVIVFIHIVRNSLQRSISCWCIRHIVISGNMMEHTLVQRSLLISKLFCVILGPVIV
jgi:hypothetical protein